MNRLVIGLQVPHSSSQYLHPIQAFSTCSRLTGRRAARARSKAAATWTGGKSVVSYIPVVLCLNASSHCIII